MRSKSKTATEMVIDYSTAKFDCIVSKKKLFGSSKRYLYIFDSQIVINKEAKKRKYDRILMIELIRRVIWRYSDKRTQEHRVLRGFTLDYIDKSYEYWGEELQLKALKQKLAKILFQARVQDEYEAQQVIGQGNYALVLELKHLHSPVKLASKCIDRKKLEKIENGMKSVLNEIRIMRMLSPHDSVVNLHEVYEGDNNIYLIMDLAEGGSLYHEMKTRKYLFTRKDIQLILKNILSTLDYMHKKNIMHRDLKPENILYGVKGDYSTQKIADFGLSTICNEVPYLYPKCGTPGFVAPEVANLVNKTEGYSQKCDIFSAGVIFHVLLFGEGLFAGKGHQDILKLNKKCEINLFHKKYDMIDQDARDLLFKMIEVDPTKRFDATQALEHEFFLNETGSPYPKLIKQSSSDVGELKLIPAGTQSPFHNYMAAELTPSPDRKQDIDQLEELKFSIVTRTPIYRGDNERAEQQERLSDFDLEKERLNLTNCSPEKGEEFKDLEHEKQVKRMRYLSFESPLKQ